MEGIIRKLIAGLEIHERPPDSYFAVRRELAAIGNNINQIAYVANLSKNVTPEQVRQLQEDMGQIWTLVLEKM